MSSRLILTHYSKSNVEPILQERDYTCWAAVICHILPLYGYNVSQDQIIELARNKYEGYCLNNPLCDEENSAEAIESILTLLTGRLWKTSAIENMSSRKIVSFMKALLKNRTNEYDQPFIARLKNMDSTIGHVVVVIGTAKITEVRGIANEGSLYFHICDPANGESFRPAEIVIPKITHLIHLA